MESSVQSFRRRDRSVRMTFRYEQGRIELVERQELDTVAPPTQELPAGKEQGRRSGFWVELRDADGNTIYKRGMRNPIRVSVEVSDGEGGFSNAVSVAESAMFSLLVPNLPEATELALFASPLDSPHVPQPAREVAREPLRPQPPGGRPDKGDGGDGKGRGGESGRDGDGRDGDKNQRGKDDTAQ